MNVDLPAVPATGRHLGRWVVIAAIVGGFFLGTPLGQAASAPGRRAGSATSTAKLGGGKVQHVVIIYQENHSFDNVLGLLCAQDHRCDGATTGQLHNGTVVPLSRATDFVIPAAHGPTEQAKDIAGGAMNGWDLVSGCTDNPPPPTPPHQCYTQYDPTQVPNLASAARQFALSDRTFELSAIPSWGAHLELVAAQLDGFVGFNPVRTAVKPGPGLGCDSNKDAFWAPNPGAPRIKVPSCVPTPAGRGPNRSTPVKWVPTIMDRLDGAGLKWTLYTGNGGYEFAICPTFADCLLTSQHNNLANPSQVISDASGGKLPAFSIVLPEGPQGATSQHNGNSMIAGDNWIGQVLTALEKGPEWSSTAVFVTYDDCGCFYDHVPPPNGLGIRVPMVIVSPYAIAGFTDSNPASFASMMAFTEHVYGLAPLASADTSAYDYANSFNFSQAPQVGRRLIDHTIPVATRRQMIDNPPDPNDPT